MKGEELGGFLDISLHVPLSKHIPQYVLTGKSFLYLSHHRLYVEIVLGMCMETMVPTECSTERLPQNLWRLHNDLHNPFSTVDGCYLGYK